MPAAGSGSRRGYPSTRVNPRRALRNLHVGEQGRLIFAHTAEHTRTEVRQSRVTRMHSPSRLMPKSCKLEGRQFWQSWKVDRVSNARVRSQMISTLSCWHTRTGSVGGKPRRITMCLTGAAT